MSLIDRIRRLFKTSEPDHPEEPRSGRDWTVGRSVDVPTLELDRDRVRPRHAFGLVAGEQPERDLPWLRFTRAFHDRGADARHLCPRILEAAVREERHFPAHEPDSLPVAECILHKDKLGIRRPAAGSDLVTVSFRSLS
jgi:hypothetical protein